MISFLSRNIRKVAVYGRKSYQIIYSSGFVHFIHLAWRKFTIKGKILIIDARMLTPDQDSGSYRMYGILTVLQKLRLEVSYGSVDLDYNEKTVRLLHEKGINVITKNNAESILDFIRDHATKFDIIMLERINVASWLIEPVKHSAPGAIIFFDTVDLHFLREQRMAETTGSKEIMENAKNLKKAELKVASMADVTFVVSSYEKKILKDMQSDLHIEILSNIHEIAEGGCPFKERRNLMFIGGFEHVPNVDAMLFFVNDIFPLIQKRIRDVKLYIVGSNPPEEVSALSSKNIIVTGYVENISLYFRKTRVFVAPLRYGAGVKGKINMSMSYGLPVVGTSIAIEGMYLNDGKDILKADTEDEFCQKVIDLYTDEKLWNRLSNNGYTNIDNHFSKKVAKDLMEQVLKRY